MWSVGEISIQFLSTKEYLETNARSRAAFDLPKSGRGSSIKSLGVNLSFPPLKLDSQIVDILRDGTFAGGRRHKSHER